MTRTHATVLGISDRRYAGNDQCESAARQQQRDHHDARVLDEVGDQHPGNGRAGSPVVDDPRHETQVNERYGEGGGATATRYLMFAIYSNYEMGESIAFLLSSQRCDMSPDAFEKLRERLAHVDEDQGWFFAQIADQVSEQRKANELSQKELAELTGTTQSAIARLESGGRPPRIDTLLRIAEALDCDLTVELKARTATSR